MLLTLIIIVCLLVCSAFFSGSETGVTAAAKPTLHALKKEGNKRASLVLRLQEQGQQLIGTILLGNNLVNILASALATSVGIHYFGAAGVAYATVVMTLLVLIFAEFLPKSVAITHAERVALLVAPMLRVLMWCFFPITWLIQHCVRLMLRLVGATHAPSQLIDGNEMVRGAIEWHHDAGDVVKNNKDMLGGVLDLDDVSVTEVMIHRKAMQMLDAALGEEKLLDAVLESQFTRLPVWQENPDNIIGVLHAKDVLRAVRGGPFVLDEVLREPWFIPETTSLAEQLAAFKARKTHFALVVDEYGDILGLVTLEDILEEIVGQIEDEHDDGPTQMDAQDDGSFVVDGSITLRDVNREMEWQLEADQATTLAGFIIARAGVIPGEGQIFQFDGFRFTILKKSRHQIISIHIRRMEP